MQEIWQQLNSAHCKVVQLHGVNEGMKMKLILNQKCGLVGQSISGLVGQQVSGSVGSVGSVAGAGNGRSVGV